MVSQQGFHFRPPLKGTCHQYFDTQTVNNTVSSRSSSSLGRKKMAFTSSITTNMNEYLVTCDKITLRAFFRCGVDRINNALVLQEDDRDRMLYDEVIIKRPFVRKLLMALIRRVYVNEGNLGGIYVEEIAPGLVVTPAEKTVSPGNTMSCLRICLSVDHAVLPQPPAPRVHFVHIPVIHALGLVGYMLCREQSIEHVIPLPAETPTFLKGRPRSPSDPGRLSPGPALGPPSGPPRTPSPPRSPSQASR